MPSGAAAGAVHPQGHQIVHLGDLASKFNLGLVKYMKGSPRGYAEARRLWGLAAAQGDARAQFNLGSMHHQGNGGPHDFAEARRLYGLAAAQGDARAQFNLGLMHAHGKGRPQDWAEARRLIGLAAAQGHAKAQASLAGTPADGARPPEDPLEELAAEVLEVERRLDSLASDAGIRQRV